MDATLRNRGKRVPLESKSRLYSRCGQLQSNEQMYTSCSFIADDKYCVHCGFKQDDFFQWLALLFSSFLIGLIASNVWNVVYGAGAMVVVAGAGVVSGLADMAPELKPGWRNTPLSGLSESVLLASTSSSSSKHGRRTKAGTIGECTDL